jgi:hypothetical protein
MDEVPEAILTVFADACATGSSPCMVRTVKSWRSNPLKAPRVDTRCQNDGKLEANIANAATETGAASS